MNLNLFKLQFYFFILSSFKISLKSAKMLYIFRMTGINYSNEIFFFFLINIFKYLKFIFIIEMQ
jgi:hypothetical protein